MASHMDVTGAMRDIRKLARGARDEFAQAQYEETQVEAKECQNVCPYKTHTLQKSIHATEPVIKGNVIITAVVAGEEGSGAEDYALEVHENLDAFHPHGEAQYIARPLNASAPYMGKRIAARIDLNRALKG